MAIFNAIMSGKVCPTTSRSVSYSYKTLKCRCIDCKEYKRLSARRDTKAKERSRAWRLKNLERSRANSKRYQLLHPEKLLEWKLRKYGLTPKEYYSFGDKCMICGGGPKGMQNGKGRICVDHDKETKKVRGVLCGTCNVGIGHFHHNIKLLRSAIKYLEENGDV